MRKLCVVLLLAGCSLAPPPGCCPSAPVNRNGGSLAARAAEFQRIADTKLRPHWSYGALVNVQFADSTMNQVTGYNDLPDAAIWTGVYTAAQSYRYAAALNDEERREALRAVRDSVGTLHQLAAVAHQNGVLARFATTDLQTIGGSCTTTTSPPCYQTGDDYWLGNTSRDQYTGWFFGMSAAYRLVPDPEIRATIAGDVRTVITAIHDWNYVIHGPDGPNTGTAGYVHHQMRLTWHLIAATILNEPLYWHWYHQQTQLIDLAEADLEDAADGTNIYYDYYSYNLGFLNGFNLVILEQEPKLKAFYLRMLEDELYRYVKGTGNAFFDYMSMAATGQPSATTIGEDLASLHAFPGPPAVYACVQPPPMPLDPRSVRLHFINRLISKKQMVFPQAKRPYPLDQRCSVDFIWQASPYKESCCCDCAPASGGNCPASSYSPRYCASTPVPQSGYVVYPGADYLVAYWMGRYYGFIAPGA